MKKGERKTPVVVFNPFLILTPNDKAKLRVMLVDPSFVKLLGACQKLRPSANCALAGSKQRDQFSNERAQARLSEMHGWDLFQTAIFAVLSEEAMRRAVIPANYPDSGRVDAGFGEIVSPEPKT